MNLSRPPNGRASGPDGKLAEGGSLGTLVLCSFSLLIAPPLGVLALVLAIRAGKLRSDGRIREAASAARFARNLALFSLISVVVTLGLLMLFFRAV